MLISDRSLDVILANLIFSQIPVALVSQSTSPLRPQASPRLKVGWDKSPDLRLASAGLIYALTLKLSPSSEQGWWHAVRTCPFS